MPRTPPTKADSPAVGGEGHVEVHRRGKQMSNDVLVATEGTGGHTKFQIDESQRVPLAVTRRDGHTGGGGGRSTAEH